MSQLDTLVLSALETKAILESIGRSPYLLSKYQSLHTILGSGIWIIKANSALELKNMKVENAVYIPLTSVYMFFNDQVLANMKIDPAKQMLVGLIYTIPLKTGPSIKYAYTSISFNPISPTPVTRSLQMIPKKTTPTVSCPVKKINKH